MGELSIHRWKGFELYPVINKKTVSQHIATNTYLDTLQQWLKSQLDFARKFQLALFLLF